ncbi:MAG: response regulator [bacterium]
MKNILALDDDPEILKCLKLALDTRGFQCTTTDNYQTFFDIFKQQHFDLVLLDVRMPRKSGFDVLKTLRHKKKTPVLFITAYAGSFTLESQSVLDMWQKEFADGNTDILYKPFTLASLYEKVEALIGPAEEQG